MKLGNLRKTELPLTGTKILFNEISSTIHSLGHLPSRLIFAYHCAPVQDLLICLKLDHCLRIVNVCQGHISSKFFSVLQKNRGIFSLVPLIPNKFYNTDFCQGLHDT